MPHLPVRTRDDFRGKSRSGLYGDVIQTIDWSVGEVLKALTDTGKDENTLVVFTSDNGPWLNLPARMLQDWSTTIILPYQRQLKFLYVANSYSGGLGHLEESVEEGFPRVVFKTSYPGLASMPAWTLYLSLIHI